MVCEKCEAKLTTLIVPDKWKDGARNVTGGKDGGRAVGTNKLVEKKRISNRFSPMERRCRICRSKIGQNAHYCNQCAYQKGICSMCGRKMLDISQYNMSSNLSTLLILDPDSGVSMTAGTKVATVETIQSPNESHLPILPNTRIAPLRLPSTKTVNHAYQDLVQSESAMKRRLEKSLTQRKHMRSKMQRAIEHLSDDTALRQRKEEIRYQTVKREIDYLQQDLNPFITTTETNHERQTYSSVYRHQLRLKDIQKMGITVFGLDPYVTQSSDKLLVVDTDRARHRKVQHRRLSDAKGFYLTPRPPTKTVS
uniref:Cysteine-rich PDZ-binding protein n=1 Tax=Albugo laibachii Nc14 TaxID=890382 RepID=F0WBV0_9STRA|nr:conserved unknown protein putative [Albugo laibachii Nc14]|eukprot:CCA18627.1 conserved unknown protein putative [Albugo laibachii Nc14]